MKMTSWLVIFRGFFQSLFFFFFLKYIQKNSKTSKVIFKYFIIFLKIWTGQSLLTLSLKNAQTEPQFFFQPNK